MKKLFIVLFSILLICSSCGNSEPSTDNSRVVELESQIAELKLQTDMSNTSSTKAPIYDQNEKQYKIDDISYSMPSDWLFVDSGLNSNGLIEHYFYGTGIKGDASKGYAYIAFNKVNLADSDKSDYIDELFNGINEKATANNYYDGNFNNAPSRLCDYSLDNGMNKISGHGLAYFSGNGVILVVVTAPNNEIDTYSLLRTSQLSLGDIENLKKTTTLTTVTTPEITSLVSATTPPTTTMQALTTNVPSETTAHTSTGELNALNTAISYLNSSAFSKIGLHNQLLFEGFTESEAEYGVTNCGADWFEQANNVAKLYLNSSSFSRQGLLDQLIYEGFSHEQAEHGVSNCGADWFEQAVKVAKSYLESSSFSRQGLLDQLIYEGFSHEQAEHGVSKNDY